MKTILPLLLALTVGACEFTPSTWVTRTQHLTAPATTALRLEARSINGKIRVHATPNATGVDIEATISGGANTEVNAQAVADAIETVAETRDGVVHVGWKWADPSMRGRPHRVDFLIRCPDRLEMDLATTNGELTLDGANGECRLRCTNGRISVQGAPNRIELDTTNGSIHGELMTEGALGGRVETTNGNITFELTSAVSTRISAALTNGSIDCELPATNVEAGRRAWAGTLGDGEGSLALETTNGSIRVK